MLKTPKKACTGKKFVVGMSHVHMKGIICIVQLQVKFWTRYNKSINIGSFWILIMEAGND